MTESSSLFNLVENPSIGRKLKILLLENEPASLAELKGLLADPRLDVEAVDSTDEAIRRSLEQNFVAIFLNDGTADGDGFAAAKRIREGERGRRTPILFVTACYGDGAWLEKACGLGAVDFLRTPLAPIFVRAKTAALIELFEQTERRRLAETHERLERQAFEQKTAAQNTLLREQAERFRVTLGSIGDGVITTDAECRVTFLNSVASSLTGWTPAEAEGALLCDVFQIVNEETRAAVENPAVRAMELGIIVGLANHTLLIAKNGLERPIDDSAAPIRDAAGAIVGGVLVFRDVTERRRSERALRRSEERKAAVLRAALDAIITIDDEGRIVEFNPAAEKLFGYSQAEAIGAAMEELIVPTFLRESYHRGMAHYLATGEGPALDRPMETPALLKNGGEIVVELFVARLKGRRPFFTGFVRDVTARKQAEAALADRVRLLALGAEVGAALIEAATLGDALQRCTQAMVEQLDGAFARIWIYNPKDHMLELRASAGLYTHLDGGHARVPVGKFKIGLIAHERKPHLTNAVVGDQRVPEQEWAKREGMVAFAGYPLIVEDRLVGVMAMFARRPLAPHTLQAMASVANAIALGVERMRVEREIAQLLAHEQQRSDRLRQLAAASLTINSATTASSLIGVVRAEAKRIIGADHSEVSLRNDATPHGSLSAPLIGRGSRTIGHIHLTDKTDGDFTADDEALLTQLAHMAAVAFDNARLYEDLREGDLRKDEFLATLAHELRNPLAPIRNSLQIMRLPGADQAALELSRNMIERQVQQMVRLVDDLLDLSRISRGKMELRLERVELTAVLNSAIETSRPLIADSQHELTVSIPKNAVWLNADPTRLAQVFLNLLNNAAKYTPRGGRISLTAELEGNAVIVRIRDNGVGVSAEMLPRIFEMFTQADHSLEKSQGGLGVGLTLVRRLTELHGGVVEAHSEGLGRGSEFVVRLPIPPEAASGASETAAVAVARRSRRILVVDDNRDSAESLVLLFRMLGDEVRAAYDGVEAVDSAATFHPEIVLLDIGLPRLNGYEAARRIRAQPGANAIVLIALTGWGQAEDRRRSREAGFDHHLVKPVELKALEKLLSEMESR